MCQPEIVRADVLHINSAHVQVNLWLSCQFQLHRRLWQYSCFSIAWQENVRIVHFVTPF